VVVYIVTPSGIVIGADGLVVPVVPCWFIGPPSPPFTARKIFLLRHKLALSSVGIEAGRGRDGSFYSFPTWVKVFDYNAGSDATVSSVAQSVEDESAEALSFLAASTDKAPACPSEKQAFDDHALFVEYTIAGYEAGVPVVYRVQLKPYREHPGIKSLRIPVEPEQGQRIDARSGISDQNTWWRLVAVCSPKAHPNAYEVAFSRFPSKSQAFCANDFSGFTLEQASDTVRILIEIFAEVEPNRIGFPLTIVTIPKNGLGRVRTYSKRFRSLPHCASGNKKRRQQDQEHAH
jgi:hypothetical protein